LGGKNKKNTNFAFCIILFFLFFFLILCGHKSLWYIFYNNYECGTLVDT
jgi:hypothetical protein